MPWTQGDADAVREAILKLAAGTRVVTIKYAGPPARELTYQQADLKVLKELLAEMESVATASTTGGYRLAATRKGLG
jgi:hypothetical protein